MMDNNLPAYGEPYQMIGGQSVAPGKQTVLSGWDWVQEVDPATGEITVHQEITFTVLQVHAQD